MRLLIKPVVLIAVVAGIVWALTSWPRLREVETGKTPESPELRVRDYSSAEGVVAKAAKTSVERLPRWSFAGSGSRPGGTEIRAVASGPWWPVKSDVTIRIRREAGKTRISVRSRSRTVLVYFGQTCGQDLQLFVRLELAKYLP